MDQRTLGGANISRLRREYTWRIAVALPQAARAASGWPVSEDHCFARVVLDTLFDDGWYDHVDGRPAYEQLSGEQLRAAIDIADRMLEGGQPVVEELNERSLRRRGKLN